MPRIVALMPASECAVMNVFHWLALLMRSASTGWAVGRMGVMSRVSTGLVPLFERYNWNLKGFASRRVFKYALSGMEIYHEDRSELASKFVSDEVVWRRLSGRSGRTHRRGLVGVIAVWAQHQD